MSPFVRHYRLTIVNDAAHLLALEEPSSLLSQGLSLTEF